MTNQLNQPTQKPKMKWIFRLFQGVQLWRIQFETYVQEIVVNLTEPLKAIVRHLSLSDLWCADSIEADIAKALSIYWFGGGFKRLGQGQVRFDWRNPSSMMDQMNQKTGK